MNGNETGLVLACLVCLVPFLAGVGATLFIQSRVRRLGKPWGFLPAGSILKALWEAYSR
jgi:hypothetical protein